MLNCKDFISELDELLTRSKGRVGVFMLDLDRFHLVNEIAGHDVGESLLEKVKERLILNAPANCAPYAACFLMDWDSSPSW